MMAIFLDDNTSPIKSVHVGVEGCHDYTVAPHDKDRRMRYIERH